MGLRWEDVTAEVLADLPFETSETEVAATIIQYLKGNAEMWLAKHIRNCRVRRTEAITEKPYIDKCVITVPAHFDECSREATRKAASLAGFTQVVTLIESTAAAMAYGLFVAGTKTVCVFDMGGALQMSPS